MNKKQAMAGRDIIPVSVPKKCSYRSIMEIMASTCFEARNIAAGAGLLEKMINEGDTIWLGIAGAGIVGGLGGYVIELIKKGFVDVICSTGAQVYHDLHFAYGLPVKQGCPKADDNKLREVGVTRIYDLFIDEEQTLLAQDEMVRRFALGWGREAEFSSAEFNYAMGNFVLKDSPHPERSFVATAAKFGVPVFFDSNSNHSVAMNLAAVDMDISSKQDVLQSAAIVYSSKSTGFFELGGGGPKNFIQQTGPTISQIFGLPFHGADRGLQITTASERDGGLSGCTFGEGVTWGKYKNAEQGLVQIWGEYSYILPLIAGYAFESCKRRKYRRIATKLAGLLSDMRQAVDKR